MPKKFIILLIVAISILMPCTAAEKNSGKLPILDCIVILAHGGFDAYGGPIKSDKITIDLNEVEKIKDKLEFKSSLGQLSYIPLRAPFQLTKKESEVLPGSLSMKFISVSKNAPTTKVAISIIGQIGGAGSKRYDIYIVTESFDLISGVAVLEGIARD